MFEKFFDSSPRGLARVRALRNGQYGALLDGFARDLGESQYANITARRYIRSAEHFIDVSIGKGIPVPRWDSHALDSFRSHLSRRRCSYGHNEPMDQVTGARLFLQHLRAAGVIRTPLVEPPAEPGLLVAFRRWMHEQRGTCDATLGNYRMPILELLKALGEDPQRFDASGLRCCFLSYCARRGPVPIKHGATAMRMFLRFLIADGRCPAGLDAAIPLIPHWRLSSLPRYLQPDEVERIIHSCDLATSVGKRDRAILLLLARLGLRAGDVTRLRLSDIDWQDAWIQVCGKTRRPTRLPLTREVGEAVVDYLENGRASTDDDHVFVLCCAPFRSFTSYHAISATVRRAMRRAGVAGPGRGAAHLLRHSVATSLLRHGASLQDIATVLRHRSVQTTQIYAKVDLSALRQIAQAWPEVRPC